MRAEHEECCIFGPYNWPLGDSELSTIPRLGAHPVDIIDCMDKCCDFSYELKDPNAQQYEDYIWKAMVTILLAEKFFLHFEALKMGGIVSLNMASFCYMDKEKQG
eukprot:Gb_05470 [translate_table: standard]